MIGTYFPAINMKTVLFTSPIAENCMMDENYFYAFFQEHTEQFVSETMDVISKYMSQRIDLHFSMITVSFIITQILMRIISLR